jgi:hypothetical protein
MVFGVLVLVLLMSFGCTTLDVVAEKENAAVFFNETYIKEFKKQKADVEAHNKRVLATPDDQLTAEQLASRNEYREFLKDRKKVLDEVKPMLDMYNAYLLAGQPLPEGLEDKIKPLIQQLLVGEVY